MTHERTHEVRFTTSAEVVVTVEADTEDVAADRAWEIAQEHLATAAVSDGRKVAIYADLDGIGADEVVER